MKAKLRWEASCNMLARLKQAREPESIIFQGVEEDGTTWIITLGSIRKAFEDSVTLHEALDRIDDLENALAAIRHGVGEHGQV